MKKNLFEVIHENDQFMTEKNLGRVAKGFTEGKISFAPTYKLNKN